MTKQQDQSHVKEVSTAELEGVSGGETLTNHGSYWTTDKVNSAAAYEFRPGNHLGLQKDGTYLLGSTNPRAK
jgi:hypothetical protein